MFRRTQMMAAMSQQLVDELTDLGPRDLLRMRMDDLESEVYELVDAITRRAVRGVLEDQARVCEMTHYPRCGREHDHKPPEEKTFATGRGEVTWNQPVKRCSRQSLASPRRDSRTAASLKTLLGRESDLGH